jgi:hypothetical protein
MLEVAMRMHDCKIWKPSDVREGVEGVDHLSYTSHQNDPFGDKIYPLIERFIWRPASSH